MNETLLVMNEFLLYVFAIVGLVIMLLACLVFYVATTKHIIKNSALSTTAKSSWLVLVLIFTATCIFPGMFILGIYCLTDRKRMINYRVVE